MNKATENKLAYLQETKDAIKAALIEQGQTVADTDTFRSYADKVLAIEGGGGTSGDERVKYVTFMNGDTELLKYPVIAGDTCHDTVGKLTKEPTVSIVYEHVGWSLSDGGDADPDALKNVTENRTVYAAFTATARKYTITYFDEDGVTVLNTEQLAYGTMPGYMPSKEGCSFDRWTPSFVTVTGDANYTASWIEQITFAKGSWADIARISEAGEASDYFNVGDTRTEQWGGYGSVTVKILGFDHDNLADGSGKAGMSIGMTHHIDTNSSSLNTANANIPAELRAVMKNITYSTCKNSTSTSTVSTSTWAGPISYSWGEIGYANPSPYSGKTYYDGCTKYASPPSLDKSKYYTVRGNYDSGNGTLYFKFYNAKVAFTGTSVVNEKFIGHFCV